MTRPSALHRVATIAVDQWGLITRRQAELAGVSPATLKRMSGAQGVLERVAQGVYHVLSAPLPDHVDLRAAWLQLAPETPAWDRTSAQGVVSHRSAAALYGIGDLPADTHEFTFPTRRQSRRPDVRLHIRRRAEAMTITLHGLPVTRPARIASDLLHDREDPTAVAQIAAEAMDAVYDYPGSFADELAPHAAHFGLRRGDGLAVLRWLLDLVGDPQADRYMQEAQEHVDRISNEARPKTGGRVA